jgi:hypothetical protein
MPTKNSPKALKNLILMIAKNNGVKISDITKNKKISYKNVEFLNDMGLLDFGHSDIEGGSKEDNHTGLILFKKDIFTFQTIANFLDNKELLKLMKTKYFSDNLKLYRGDLINSFREIDGSSLPDEDYLDYAFNNSPSTVRFFLLENNLKSLDSFYDNCISTTRENTRDKIKRDMLEKYNMYFIWEYVLFEKIQEDLKSENLLKESNYYNGYLPIAKKKLEKLMECRNSLTRKEEISFFEGIKVLLPFKNKKHKSTC